MRRITWFPTAIVVALVVASCANDNSNASSTTTTAPPAPPAASASVGDGDGLLPNVVEAVARQAVDGSWTFDVTVSSPYDTPRRYADAWRVLAPDGTQLGIRELLHDHAGEQPFTRSLSGVEIPGDIGEVTVEARDQVNGWGGATVTLALG
jgi:hypothetical protein